MVQLTVMDTGMSDAIRRYIKATEMRGKSMHETLRVVMRYWVSFATNKIPRGDVAKLDANLKALTRRTITSNRGGRRKRAATKASNEWRGTVAAAVVSRLNYGGARGLRGDAFFRKVARFYANRKFSLNAHRSGNLPALKALKGKRGVRMPEYRKKGMGTYLDVVSGDVVDLLVENFASAAGPRSKGISGLAPDAFSSVRNEVERMLMVFTERELVKLARECGFTTGGRR